MCNRTCQDLPGGVNLHRQVRRVRAGVYRLDLQPACAGDDPHLAAEVVIGPDRAPPQVDAIGGELPAAGLVRACHGRGLGQRAADGGKGVLDALGYLRVGGIVDLGQDLLTVAGETLVAEERELVRRGVLRIVAPELEQVGADPHLARQLEPGEAQPRGFGRLHADDQVVRARRRLVDARGGRCDNCRARACDQPVIQDELVTWLPTGSYVLDPACQPLVFAGPAVGGVGTLELDPLAIGVGVGAADPERHCQPIDARLRLEPE